MFARWFSRKRAPARKASYKPEFEALERRELLSASSAAIHAVVDNFGTAVAFFVQRTSNGDFLYESHHDVAPNKLVLNPLNTGAAQPASVAAFSVGLDPTGHADVFVKADDSSLWELKEGQTAWREVLGPNLVESFAAVKGGRLYAQFMDNTLHEFDDTSWYLVPGSGPVQSLDAVTDNFNSDAVFLKLTDGTFREFYQGNYQQLAGNEVVIVRYPGFPGHPGGGSRTMTVPVVSSFSAGLDTTGHADVYAQFWSGQLEKNVNEHPESGLANNAWTEVAPGGSYKQFSATDQGAVWIISANNTVQEYDSQGVLTNTASQLDTTFGSISAASANDVWAVNNFQQLEEWYQVYSGVFAWGYQSPTDTVQQ